MLTHGAQGGHVHRLFGLIAVTRIGAAAPVGLDSEAGRSGEGVSLANLTSIAVDEEVAGAKDRDDRLKPCQIQIGSGQFGHQRAAVHPAARRLHRGRGQRAGHGLVIVPFGWCGISGSANDDALILQ